MLGLLCEDLYSCCSSRLYFTVAMFTDYSEHWSYSVEKCLFISSSDCSLSLLSFTFCLFYRPVSWRQDREQFLENWNKNTIENPYLIMTELKMISELEICFQQTPWNYHPGNIRDDLWSSTLVPWLLWSDSNCCLGLEDFTRTSVCNWHEFPLSQPKLLMFRCTGNRWECPWYNWCKYGRHKKNQLGV